ncbi:MAG: HAD hydrolase family protein, partial [Eubacteriales bacterium]
MNIEQITAQELQQIKLVCSDVDGTLVDDGTPHLNPEYYDEIRRLKEKGILFAAVTGRAYDSCK